MSDVSVLQFSEDFVEEVKATCGTSQKVQQLGWDLSWWSHWALRRATRKQTRAGAAPVPRRSNRGRALVPGHRRARIPQETLEPILELRATESAIRVSFAMMEEVVKRAQGQRSEGKSLSFALYCLVVWDCLKLGNDVLQRLCLSGALFSLFCRGRNWSSQTSARQTLHPESKQSSTGSFV